MKRQGLDPLLPTDYVNANHWRFTRKLDGCDDRIQLGHVEVEFKFFTRFPFLHEQQRLMSIEVRIEARIQAARCNPRRS